MVMILRLHFRLIKSEQTLLRILQRNILLAEKSVDIQRVLYWMNRHQVGANYACMCTNPITFHSGFSKLERKSIISLKSYSLYITEILFPQLCA
jgi:hypothetical protein